MAIYIAGLGGNYSVGVEFLYRTDKYCSFRQEGFLKGTRA